jgi:hypothetical protein
MHEEDDEHFICNEGRFHSAIAASVTVSRSGEPLEYATGARRFMGNEGTADFAINLGAPLRDVRNICFRHEETGAEYEIKVLPRGWDEMQDEQVNDEFVMRSNAIMARGTMVMEAARDSYSGRAEFADNESHEDEHLDEYEDDGFLVMNEDEEEEADSSDVEEDICCICREHGDLIVCDGGDHLAGCGKSFHINCVGRDQVPPGDWVCEHCANAFELNVGIEGHEFSAEEKNTANVSNEDTRKGGKRILEDTSGDESDESIEVLAPVTKKNKVNKRTRILDSDSDDS